MGTFIDTRLNLYEGQGSVNGLPDSDVLPHLGIWTLQAFFIYGGW